MKKRAALIFLAILVVALVTGMILFARTKSRVPEFVGGPGEKGYATLMRATTLMQVAPSAAENSGMDLGMFVETNKLVLETIRQALKEPIQAPVEVYDLQLIGTALAGAGTVKALASTIELEGKYFEEKEQWRKAADSYLDIVELGQKMESGPLIFLLIGISIERKGFDDLEKIEARITNPDRKEIHARIESLMNSRIRFEAVEERERYIGLRHSPTPIHLLITSRLSRAAIKNGEAKYAAQTGRYREMLALFRDKQ